MLYLGIENDYSLFVSVCSTRIGVQIDAKFAQFGPNQAEKRKGIRKVKIGCTEAICLHMDMYHMHTHYSTHIGALGQQCV